MKLKYLGCNYEELWNKDLTIGKVYEFDGYCIIDDIEDVLIIHNSRLIHFEVIK